MQKTQDRGQIRDQPSKGGHYSKTYYGLLRDLWLMPISSHVVEYQVIFA